MFNERPTTALDHLIRARLHEHSEKARGEDSSFRNLRGARECAPEKMRIADSLGSSLNRKRRLFGCGILRFNVFTPDNGRNALNVQRSVFFRPVRELK